MIEILFICLVVWIIYAWKTGKFKKEYQDKNNAELEQSENGENLLTVSSLSQKQKKSSLKQREKYAEELAKKHGTRTQNTEITIPHQKISINNTQKNDIENHNDEFYTPEYEITYQSMGKDITTRDICFLELTKKEFDNHKYYYLEAFCFETQELRSFRVDRIIKLYDYNTTAEYVNYDEILRFVKKLDN
ncbi:WYL domain-containing protein [Acinetobacter baumannii]|uniref:WYL domain-containing protein n=1 Tax=Acinetobacter baumannii TaxID=470 RepID=UPI003D6DAA7F